jgi:hypothetical protein
MSRKIVNWAEYNKSLINRGSLTFWISEEILETWSPSRKARGAGRPKKYSDTAIQASCMVRFFFHLSLRSTEGLIRSLFQLMNLSLSTPSYSRICRRMKDLEIDEKKLSRHRPSHLLIDSTGLKIYGEGEWHRKIHGKSKRRKWKKLTIGICPKTHEILLGIPSDDSVGDPPLFRTALEAAPSSVRKVFMDGAGDCHETYAEAEVKGVKLITPPRKGARYRVGKMQTQRDRYIRQIYENGGGEEGLKQWKQTSSYHIRSLVETAMSRIKGILGARLQSRSFRNQMLEPMIKCLIINKINKLGLPLRA